MKHLILFVTTVPLLFNCQPPQHEKSQIVRKQEDYQKIDFHAHYRYDRECLEPLLKEWSMQAVIVQVAQMDPEENERRWEILKSQYQKYPDRYYLCTSFAATNIDSPDFADNTIMKLKMDIEAGAVMVKVWKVHGMEILDSEDNYVQIDDRRMQPIWDFLAEAGIPVLAHIAEPRQAWEELKEDSPHYNYYKNNPEYHAYLHPEIPSWETIIEARDRWIANNAKLTIIAAHLGSMSHDVDLVADRLEKYPNIFVEPAARFGDLTLQNSEKIRNFFIKYQNRILYGTDLGFSSPANETNPEDCEFAASVISRHWKYFTEKDSIVFDSPMLPFNIETKGLDLPDSVLKKIYYGNAMKVLGEVREFNK